MTAHCTMGVIIHHCSKAAMSGLCFQLATLYHSEYFMKKISRAKNLAILGHGFWVSSCDLLYNRTDYNRRNLNVPYLLI
jgi:hypothetical protein